MPSLLIRDIPEKTYQRIKDNAERHRRSLAKEALVMLEQRLDPYDVPKLDWRRLPKIKLKNAPEQTAEMIRKMINEGRE